MNENQEYNFTFRGNWGALFIFHIITLKIFDAGLLDIINTLNRKREEIMQVTTLTADEERGYENCIASTISTRRELENLMTKFFRDFRSN